MIEERFLAAAVNIRRTYIRLTSNLDLYRDKAEGTLKKLETAYEELEKLQERIKKSKNKENSEPVTEDLLKILTDIEDEGNRIEKFVEPLNKEIEKLAIEEQELYRNICEAHSTLSEDQIVDIVRERLNKENLL
jgi:DNA repair ATPase RecN